MIVGLTGPNAAGKGVVASLLEQRGFALHSLSDVVRAEARRRGLPPERHHLIRIGNELRRAGGPGALARGILPLLGNRDVVDSIRNPSEVEVLRGLPRFVLIGVSAPVGVRFARALERRRPGDPTTLETFRERECEENSADPTSQQLDATLGMADVVLDNGGSVEELEGALDRLLRDLEGEPRGAEPSRSGESG